MTLSNYGTRTEIGMASTDNGRNFDAEPEKVDA